METVAPFRNRHPDVPFMQWPVHEFTFLDESRHHNTTTEQRKPSVERYWGRCGPHYVDGDGAESFAQFIERMIDIFSRLRALESGLSIIFTHEHVMRAAAWLTATGLLAADSRAMRSYNSWRKSWTVPNLGTLPMHLTADGVAVSHPLVPPIWNTEDRGCT